jgi:hypothetical protein
MAISGTRFGGGRPSLWQVNQAWAQKRKAMVQNFQANSQASSSGFMSAWSNQISGSTQLITQSTVARLQAEAKAKQAKALSQLDFMS